MSDEQDWFVYDDASYSQDGTIVTAATADEALRLAGPFPDGAIVFPLSAAAAIHDPHGDMLKWLRQDAHE